jgi:hypothetical protein
LDDRGAQRDVCERVLAGGHLVPLAAQPREHRGGAQHHDAIVLESTDPHDAVGVSERDNPHGAAR